MKVVQLGGQFGQHVVVGQLGFPFHKLVDVVRGDLSEAHRPAALVKERVKLFGEQSCDACRVGLTQEDVAVQGLWQVGCDEGSGGWDWSLGQVVEFGPCDLHCFDVRVAAELEEIRGSGELDIG